MANDVRYFKVESDTSLPRAYRAVRDNSGTIYDYEVEGVAYDAGSYVASNHIDPRVLERLDDGDDHLNSLLTEVDESEVEENAAEVKAAAQLVRFPEHTVEAHKLASDPDEPYTLLSEEEGVELTSLRFDEMKEAQEAAKEENDDDLPDEEFNPIDFAVAKGEADKDGSVNTPSEVVKANAEEDKPKRGGKKKVDSKKAAEEGKVSPSRQTEAGQLPDKDKE